MSVTSVFVPWILAVATTWFFMLPVYEASRPMVYCAVKDATPPITNVEEVELVVAETKVGPLSNVKAELLPSFKLSFKLSCSTGTPPVFETTMV